MIIKTLGDFAILAGFGIGSQALASSYAPDQWERQIVAACLILEASNQGGQGMTAVANVMQNRADGNPNSIYREVRKPYAFKRNNRENRKSRLCGSCDQRFTRSKLAIGPADHRSDVCGQINGSYSGRYALFFGERVCQLDEANEAHRGYW